MESTIYNLLTKQRKTAISIYKTLLELKGFWCIIKEPVHQESIFGLEDVVEYDEEVVNKRKLLLFGIFQETEQGMEDFDAFIEAYALTLWEDKIPQQSLVQVEFCNRKMNFKVDTHRNLMPSNCKQLFIKNMLVPAT